MERVALSLGTNLGDREHYMDRMVRGARSLLSEPVAVSLLMETEPLGMEGCELWFLNRIVCGGYADSPQALLRECRAIENELGRTRAEGISSRTADVDILLYGDAVIADTNLTVPHPQILDRRFCLEGLNQTAPDWLHPTLGKTFGELYGGMRDKVRRQGMRFPAGKR
jgi:2-amino-4-hydroxy-6-hydroxymethyldihydropteridine diphosphokinase